MTAQQCEGMVMVQAILHECARSLGCRVSELRWPDHQDAADFWHNRLTIVFRVDGQRRVFRLHEDELEDAVGDRDVRKAIAERVKNSLRGSPQ